MIPHRSEVRYSKNHNLLRSVGFVTVLAAVGATGLITDLLEFSDVKVDAERFSDLVYQKRVVDRWGQKHQKRWACSSCTTLCNVGILVTRLPCLEPTLACNLCINSTSFTRLDPTLLSRSFASTGRSWLNPGGNMRKCTLLANVLVMRLLYMYLGHRLHSPTVTKICCCCSRNSFMLSHYSWDFGTHGSGEYTSWLSSQCLRCWPQLFVNICHTYAHKFGVPSTFLGPYGLLQVMFAWGPMQRFLAACSARTGTSSITVYHASFLPK